MKRECKVGPPAIRLLIAQSVAEPLRFLTADAALKAYCDLVAVAD